MSADAITWVERRLLHTMLTQPSRIADVNLRPQHFTTETFAELFEFIVRANLDGVADFINVAELAEREGRKHISTICGEIACDRDLWPSTNLRHECSIILGGWRSREAMQIASQLREDAMQRDEEAVDRAIASLMALHAEDRNCEHTAQSAMRQAWDEVEAAHAAGGKLVGVSTGLADLDESLGGLHKSDLIVIGARPAMGKTGLLLGMTTAASKHGPVGLISGEQPASQVGLRWMAGGSGVSVGKLRAAKIEDDQWGRLSHAVQDIGARPIRLLDRSSPDIAEVIRVARRWKQQHGITALYVDYLQRLEIGGMSKAPKHERIGAIARALKNLARDLDIPVVALAQVGRQVEQRENQRPMMSDLSDSSEIEKEADQIMTLWRDTSNPNAEMAAAEIIVCKNRHGNIGTVHCLWRGATTSFVNIANERAYHDGRMAAAGCA